MRPDCLAAALRLAAASLRCRLYLFSFQSAKQQDGEMRVDEGMEGGEREGGGGGLTPALPGRARLNFRMAPPRPRHNISAHIPVCVSVIMWGKEATAPTPLPHSPHRCSHRGKSSMMGAKLR